MYFVFNRDTLELEGTFATVNNDHSAPPFIVLPKGDDQDAFRKTLDLLGVSVLEVKLMWRNVRNVSGPIYDYRDNLISAMYYLLTSGKALTRNTATLFNEEAEHPAPATGPDRTAAPVTAQAKAPSAPRGGNRATIFEVADRMWNEAGSPVDPSVVLPLRKTIMAELEANNGIKKTTSSTALGEWQKLRLNK